MSFFVKRTDRDGLLLDRQHHVLFQDRVHGRAHITDLHERHEHGVMHNTRSWLRLSHWTFCAHGGRPAYHLEKAFGQDFLAMHPVSFLFSHLTKVPNVPPGTSVVNTLSCCVKRTWRAQDPRGGARRREAQKRERREREGKSKSRRVKRQVKHEERRRHMRKRRELRRSE